MNEISLFKVRMNTELVVEMLKPVIISGMITQASKVEEFEAKLSEFFDWPYVLTLNSATSGLTLAYRLLNIQRNEPVISTPLTCFATTCAITANTDNIIWVDTDPNTCNIDLELVKSKLNKDTRILSIVHWGGVPVNLDKVNELKNYAKDTYKVDLQVVEDCAHALGTEWDGRKLGTHGNIAVYSLQAIKHLTTGDGGLILLPNEELYKRAKLLRWYGIDRERRSKPGTDFRLEPDISEWGYKFHMNDINATIGLANMMGLQESIDKHRENADWYNMYLPNLSGHVVLFEPDRKANPSYWVYTLKVTNGMKPLFLNFMKNKGIVVSQVHARNDKHSCVSRHATYLPSLDKLEKEIVCIPCGWWVTKNDREYIFKCIQEFNYISAQPVISLIDSSQESLDDYTNMLLDLNGYSGEEPRFSQEMMSQIYIMKLGDQKIGSAKLYIENKIYKPVGHIEDVVIRKQYRGYGYGKELVRHLARIAIDNKKCYKVVLEAKTELRGFYKDCGFEVTGESYTIRSTYNT